MPLRVLLVGPCPPPHGGISVHVATARRALRRGGCAAAAWSTRAVTAPAAACWRRRARSPRMLARSTPTRAAATCCTSTPTVIATRAGASRCWRGRRRAPRSRPRAHAALRPAPDSSSSARARRRAALARATAERATTASSASTSACHGARSLSACPRAARDPARASGHAAPPPTRAARERRALDREPLAASCRARSSSGPSTASRCCSKRWRDSPSVHPDWLGCVVMGRTATQAALAMRRAAQIGRRSTSTSDRVLLTGDLSAPTLCRADGAVGRLRAAGASRRRRDLGARGARARGAGGGERRHRAAGGDRVSIAPATPPISRRGSRRCCCEWSARRPLAARAERPRQDGEGGIDPLLSIYRRYAASAPRPAGEGRGVCASMSGAECARIRTRARESIACRRCARSADAAVDRRRRPERTRGERIGRCSKDRVQRAVPSCVICARWWRPASTCRLRRRRASRHRRAAVAALPDLALRRRGGGRAAVRAPRRGARPGRGGARRRRSTGIATRSQERSGRGVTSPSYDTVRRSASATPSGCGSSTATSICRGWARPTSCSGEERYAREVVAQMLRLDRSEPARHSACHWHSSLEIAIRCAVVVVGPVLRAALATRSTRRRRAASASRCFAQLDHVARYPSVWSSPNTHLLGEATALYVGGLPVPRRPPRAALARAGARRCSSARCERQMLDDGMHAELSPYYHCYAVDFYLQALALGSALRATRSTRRAVRASRRCSTRCARFSLVPTARCRCSATTTAGGCSRWARARTIATAPTCSCAGAVLFGRGDWKRAGAHPARGGVLAARPRRLGDLGGAAGGAGAPTRASLDRGGYVRRAQRLARARRAPVCSTAAVSASSAAATATPTRCRSCCAARRAAVGRLRHRASTTRRPSGGRSSVRPARTTR